MLNKMGHKIVYEVMGIVGCVKVPNFLTIWKRN